MNNIDKIQIKRNLYLIKITNGMDLPKYRRLNFDYEWLHRNAGIRNSQHPNYPKLMKFLNFMVTRLI